MLPKNFCDLPHRDLFGTGPGHSRFGEPACCKVSRTGDMIFPYFCDHPLSSTRNRSMNIGLYFGSFNPIHTGHLIIANHVAYHTEADKVWLVVSPQNPLKPSAGLLNEYDRLHLVQLAVEDEPRLRASNVEFSLPRPSYTIDTLTYLSEKFPAHRFSVIMGSDSFENISRWKNYQRLLEQYPVYVYKRPGHPAPSASPGKITVLDAPLLDISASLIRNSIREKKSIRYLVPEKVMEYILANNYYG